MHGMATPSGGKTCGTLRCRQHTQGSFLDVNSLVIFLAYEQRELHFSSK